MIEYVQHMVREHNENYKVWADAVRIYYQHKSHIILHVMLTVFYDQFRQWQEMRKITIRIHQNRSNERWIYTNGVILRNMMHLLHPYRHRSQHNVSRWCHRRISIFLTFQIDTQNVIVLYRVSHVKCKQMESKHFECLFLLLPSQKHVNVWHFSFEYLNISDLYNMNWHIVLSWEMLTY